MRCLFPFTTNDGNIVPCGHCHDCRQRKRSEWSVRIGHESQYSKTRYFLTLTYNDNNLPIISPDGEFSRLGDPNLDESCPVTPILYKRDTILFMKRLRKYQSTFSDMHIRFYMCGEYGSKTLRPHYHYLLFNAEKKAINRLDKIWNKGHFKIGSVSQASINYVSGYLHKKWIMPENAPKPFTNMSRNPGIGSKYLELNGHIHKLPEMNIEVKYNGNTHSLPRYYRNKLHDRNEEDHYRDLAEQKGYDRETERIQELEKKGLNPFDRKRDLESYQERRMKQLTKIKKLTL